MNYWILSLPREDMEQCIRIGTFGARKKFLLGQVQCGDKVVCYVTKEFKIIALGETTSDYYLDDTAIFRQSGAFIDRFDFKADRLKQELAFKQFIDQVSFVKDPAYWGLFSKVAIYRMTKEDWDVISSAAFASNKPSNL